MPGPLTPIDLFRMLLSGQSLNSIAAGSGVDENAARQRMLEGLLSYPGMGSAGAGAARGLGGIGNDIGAVNAGLDPAMLKSVLGQGAPLESIMRKAGMVDQNVAGSLRAGMEGGSSAAAKTAPPSADLLAAFRSLLTKKNITGAGILGGVGLGAKSAYDNGTPAWANDPSLMANRDITGMRSSGETPTAAQMAAYGGDTGGGLDAIIKMLMGGGANGGRYDTAADTLNSQANMMQAESDKAYKAAQSALAMGNAEEAKRQFNISQQWEAKRADAEAYNAQSGRMNAQTGQQNANTNQFNADVGRYGAMTDVANSAEASRNNNMLNMSRGAANQTNLAQVLGSIADAQGKLGLQIASTPKNAIAGLMIGRGQQPGAAGAYTPNNVLGFDPNSLTQAIQMAMQSSQQAMQMPAPQFDLNGAMAGLQGMARGGMQGPGITPAPPTDNSGMMMGNRIPNYNSPPPATAGYQSVLDRMRSGGAPQSAIDNFLQSASSAGQRPQ